MAKARRVLHPIMVFELDTCGVVDDFLLPGLLYISGPLVLFEATFYLIPFRHSKLWESLNTPSPAENQLPA